MIRLDSSPYDLELPAELTFLFRDSIQEIVFDRNDFENYFSAKVKEEGNRLPHIAFIYIFGDEHQAMGTSLQPRKQPPRFVSSTLPCRTSVLID